MTYVLSKKLCYQFYFFKHLVLALVAVSYVHFLDALEIFYAVLYIIIFVVINLIFLLLLSLKKISVLEKNMDSLRKDYVKTQELLHQTSLDKELLEGEKQKFCELLTFFPPQNLILL